MNKFLIFISGAITGGAIGWFVTKEKYRIIAQEEIDSVKEVYSKGKAEIKKNNTIDSGDNSNKQETAMKARLKPDLVQNAANLSNGEYIDYTKIGKSKTKEEEDKDMVKKPYIITPDEYGEFEDYDCYVLNYYSDGVLTDDADDVIDVPEDIVVSDFKDYFGKYEEDSVFVRNDKLKADYEILRDHRTYEQAIEEDYPYRR